MGICCGLCDAVGSLSRVLIIALTVIGLLLQGNAMFQCDFLNYTVDGSQGTFGMFSWQLIGEDTCTEYDVEDTSDNLLKGARAMIILAWFAAAIGGSLVLFEFICCKVCCANCFEGMAYFVAEVCSATVYMLYGTDFCLAGTTISTSDYVSSGCSFGKGATFNLLALFCYLVAAIILACTPKPKPLFMK